MYVEPDQGYCDNPKVGQGGGPQTRAEPIQTRAITYALVRHDRSDAVNYQIDAHIIRSLCVNGSGNSLEILSLFADYPDQRTRPGTCHTEEGVLGQVRHGHHKGQPYPRH